MHDDEGGAVVSEWNSRKRVERVLLVTMGVGIGLVIAAVIGAIMTITTRPSAPEHVRYVTAACMFAFGLSNLAIVIDKKRGHALFWWALSIVFITAAGVTLALGV
jgi:uncharacterized protein YacL